MLKKLEKQAVKRILMLNNFNYKNKILEIILNLIDCHVYWKNKHGSYLWCNKQFATVLGLNDSNAIKGKTDYDLYSPELAKSVVETDQTILSQGKEYQIEEIGLDSKNRKAIYLSIKTPIKDKLGNVEGLVGISMNITEKKQSEIAKQQFIMNMAHDLRTPLSGIIGIAGILADRGASAQDKEYGVWTLNAGRQLLELLNAVLEVIATEHMEDLVRKDRINLQLLAKELHNLIQPAIIAKKLTFKWRVDSNLPSIISDHIKLKRIFLNLLSNAIKFTNKGKINLAITLLAIKNNQAKIEMNISDTGIGIAKDDLEKIFDRFYRTHPSYEAEYKGYGIGLFLVKKSVDLLGGQINVFSEEGKGSCFTVTFNFPLAEEKKRPSKSQKSISKPKADKQTESVLVAEDNNLVLHVVKNLLVNLGYEVITVTEGKAALNALQTHCFNWALLDIGLPKLLGTEVAKRYRKWEKEHNKPRLPLFALTAHKTDEVKDPCEKSGIDYILNKPFTEKDVHIIQLVMEGKK